MSTETLKLINDLLDVLITSRWEKKYGTRAPLLRRRTRCAPARIRRAVRTPAGFVVDYNV